MVSNGLAIRTGALDFLLFDVCDNLQLSPTQHQKAEDRYHAITKVVSAENSPFRWWDANIYSQGSMRLRTTVKPSDTPHDLDLVCEFDVSHADVDPMGLLNEMFVLFREHGVYGGMVTKKNRCIRIEYKDEFWLDILPACRDDRNGGTCIQVPDRDLQRWKPSNPIAYADWFKNASKRIIVKFSESRRDLIVAETTVEPLPTLQATEEKAMLQLLVQLLKRWRDVHYANAEYPGAYLAFNDGIRKFAAAWREVCETHGNPGKLAKGVFGRVIDEAILRETRSMQADRNASSLGIASSGLIVPVSRASVPMVRNTNHGCL